MLTVETCLKNLEAVCNTPVADSQGNVFEITNTWDRRFISDVAEHCRNGKAISTSQSSVVIKLIDRYRDHLVHRGIIRTELDQLIAFPQYARPPYQSTVLPREVRWAGDNKLVFRCKYNAGIIDDIKKLKGTNYFLPIQYPTFFREEKLWIVDVNSGNVEKTMDVIKRHKFAFDDAVAQFFLDIENSKGKRSQIETDGESIKITVRSDDLLNAWLNTLQILEP